MLMYCLVNKHKILIKKGKNIWDIVSAGPLSFNEEIQSVGEVATIPSSQVKEA